jgi:hypothetical protein
MNDDDLKKMMNDGIELPSELAKRRTLKESSARFAKARPARTPHSVRHSVSYRFATLSLIAIGMFGALSYAVTQSSRSGGGDAGKETNLINSGQLTQYPAGIRTSVVRMIVGGTDVAKLSFNTPSDFNELTNPSWGVFHPQGGGATYTMAPGEVMASGEPGQWVFNAENEVNRTGTTAGQDRPGKDSADIIAFLPNISQVVCVRINEQLGISGAIVESRINLTASMVDKGKGPSSIHPRGGTIGDDVPAFDGQPFGCFRDGADGPFVYYHVLLER